MDQIQDWSRGIRQIVKEVAERVVALQNDDGSTASGIAWRKGFVVTADEAAGDRAKVVTRDGTVLTAELAGRDPSTDIALFKADIRSRSVSRGTVGWLIGWR
jgi:S1-C subfamily serine protease